MSRGERKQVMDRLSAVLRSECADGVIRDLREPTKEDFGWIMTSL